MLHHRIPPLLWLIGFAVLMWSASYLLPIIPLPQSIRLTSLVLLLLIAISIAVSAVFTFHTQSTTVNPIHPHQVSVLVTHGIFRISRNPMYLAMTIMLAAEMIWLQSPRLIMGIIGFIWTITHVQIIPEERALLSRFPEQYTAYQSRVRRWL